MTENPFSIAVLISGSGTTLRNLIDKQSVGQLGATIRMVISSNRAARGIEFARAARIDCQILDYREFATPESLSEPLFEACRVAQIDLVVMGGFLRRLVIPGDFANRVVNIHPSLIPAIAALACTASACTGPFWNPGPGFPDARSISWTTSSIMDQ